VERGVRFVRFYGGGNAGDDSWDAHGDIEKNHHKRAAAMDKPISGLLRDLKSRGLLDSTRVVGHAEFGRPADLPIHSRSRSEKLFRLDGRRWGSVNDLHATILHMLGLDHTKADLFL
jgi:hypothetical protein